MSAHEAWLQRPLSCPWNTASLSVGGKERKGLRGGGVGGVEYRILSFLSPLRDALNAPSRGQVTKRSKENAFSLLHWWVEIFRSPSYYSKHAGWLNIKRAVWFELSLQMSQDNNSAHFREWCLWGRGLRPLCDLLAPGWEKDRPWLQPFSRNQRPTVVRSSFHWASGQVPQAALISWHTNPHRRQRSVWGQRRQPEAVNQHCCCCERPTSSFQSAEWVRELPGWFVAWLLLSISLEITAGGGSRPGSTHSSIYQRSSSQRMKPREKNKPSAPSHTPVIRSQAISLPAELSMTIQGALQLWYLPQKFTSAFLFPLFF